MVNPLSVSQNLKGKLRLILDLRHINQFLYKRKFKLEDFSMARAIIPENSFLFSFDIKSAYHHIEIEQSCRTYLGFSWEVNDQVKFFVFNVLPFGLSSAPFLFTKVTKPLVQRWRSQGFRVLMYLDDGLGGSPDLQEASRQSSSIKQDLVSAGFLLSDSKCKWEPTKHETWLGHVIDMDRNLFMVTEERVGKLKQGLEAILEHPGKPVAMEARSLARTVGRISSMHNVLGGTGRLHTRFLYYVIDSRSSWNSLVVLSNQAIEEVEFWMSSIDKLNKQNWSRFPEISPNFDSFIWSDASATGYGGLLYCGDKVTVAQGNWSEREQSFSSTWRELKALVNMLEGFRGRSLGRTVSWYTDNQAVPLIVNVGSRKPQLQLLAKQTAEICSSLGIELYVSWIPRVENGRADTISRFLDKDDWYISYDIFAWLNTLWGLFTVDRFATCYNRQVGRFNSLFCQSGTEAINAFTVDWAGEKNWLVPPPRLIPRVVHHLRRCKAKGALIIPKWDKAYFWPVICPDGIHLADFVWDWRWLPDRGGVVHQGKFRNKVFQGNKLSFRMLALRIDFSLPKRKVLRGFSTELIHS